MKHNSNLNQFPHIRMRRLRKSPTMRGLLTETNITPENLIMPYFIIKGSNKKIPIKSMRGCHIHTIDTLYEQIDECLKNGVQSIALFPNIDDDLKSQKGVEAFNESGLAPSAIRQLKEKYPDLIIIADVALDPYTSHGQDGILNSEQIILNDQTIEVLEKQALVLALAGADFVAPSDMMDGRIGRIRKYLDTHDAIDTAILAYSAKYASCFYGPFRDAVGSASKLGSSDKKTYQLNPANIKEAIREVELDINEGADIVMVKPGIFYLDVLSKITERFDIPTFVYQVSGEYQMLRSYAGDNLDLLKSSVLESLGAFKRAGATGILSYFAKDAAKWIRENKS